MTACRRRGWSAVVALTLAALMVAGCAQRGTGPDDGSSATTTESPRPFDSSTSDAPVPPVDWKWEGPWVLQAAECGFCSPAAVLALTAVDADGQALLVSYHHRPRDDGVAFTNGTQGWASIVEPLLRSAYDGNADAEVFRVQGHPVDAANWDGLRQRLADGLATARPPQPKGGAMIADAGYDLLWASDGRRATLGANDDGGGGWTDVDAAMRDVRAGFAQG